MCVGGFKREKNMQKFIEYVLKNYDEDSDKGYILQVDVEYPKNIHDLDNNLPFLPEKVKINKCVKLVCNLYDKLICIDNFVVYIRALKQVLNHG